MEERIEVLDLCQACQRKKKEEETKQVEGRKKDDPWEKINKALRRAEGCRFFCHHTLFDTNGKEDSLMGVRTCSLVVKYRCGHEEPKHSLCMDWFDGKFCSDWKEKA